MGPFICFTIVSQSFSRQGFYLIRRGVPPRRRYPPQDHLTLEGIEGGDAAVIVAIAVIVLHAVIGIWDRLGDLVWLFISAGGSWGKLYYWYSVGVCLPSD